VQTQREITRAVDSITAAERRRLANQRKQFEALGLTSEGLKRVPGVEALRRRNAGLLNQIKGTTLDTDKTRAQLRRIARVLAGEYGKVGRDVRQAILQAQNLIDSALEGGRKLGQDGPLTKTSGLNTRRLLAGVGLSPQEIRELRGRLSGLNTAGVQLAGRGPATSTTGFGGGMGAAMVIENRVWIDGVEMQVTKQQQVRGRRNPPQKRGPNRKR
jgi:hypothetical protein